MTDRDKVERAPERICIWDRPASELTEASRGWSSSYPAGHPNEFVRADLFTTLQAERDALLRAFERVDSFAVAVHEKDGKYYSVRGDDYAVLHEVASAALHQTERDG